MPKFPAIPRLSIVVPVTSDLAAFERTLISVLENQPAGSEVLVPHDGSYQDPYELCNEVRFVTSSSSSLVDLIDAGARAARGRFVHLIAEGVQATPGWTEPAMEAFEEYSCGSVAPVIRHRTTQQIVAAGWCDGVDRLCKPACGGGEDLDSDSPTIGGAYLQASFWRRELLRSLGKAFSSSDSTEATCGYQLLSQQAGWACEIATESIVLCEASELPWETTSLARGMRLRALANHFHGGGWLRSILAATGALVTSLWKPRQTAEALGQSLAPLSARGLSKRLRLAEVTRCDDESLIVQMPQARSTITRRRAA